MKYTCPVVNVSNG